MKKKKSKEIVLCPMDKEYKMLIHYDKYIGFNSSSIFDLMSYAIKNGSWQFVNFDEVQPAIEQDFKYFRLRKCYEGLKIYSNNTLSYDDSGFHMDGHDFESLDEVRHALDNKAFL